MAPVEPPQVVHLLRRYQSEPASPTQAMPCDGDPHRAGRLGDHLHLGSGEAPPQLLQQGIEVAHMGMQAALRQDDRAAVIDHGGTVWPPQGQVDADIQFHTGPPQGGVVVAGGHSEKANLHLWFMRVGPKWKGGTPFPKPSLLATPGGQQSHLLGRSPITLDPPTLRL